MKKTLFNKAIALFLSLVLVVGLLPTTAFAATFEDLQNAIDGTNGTQVEGSDKTDHYYYGETRDTGVESWTDNGNRNVQLNDKVEQGTESGSASNVTIDSDKDIKLDLNGNNIVGNGGGEVVTVKGKLTLDDTSEGDTGKITGGTTGVATSAGSKFTMNGGEISGNETDGVGGGVVARGEFEMNGGTIDNNTAGTNGGGVYVTSTGSFEMNGGTIDKNTAGANGGGVYVKEGGKFIMNDTDTTDDKQPTISGNIADKTNGQGGGVYVAGSETRGTNGGYFELRGGTISGNEAGEGGGIFIGYGTNTNNTETAKLTMTGGTVDGNIAYVGEGGGIYIDGRDSSITGGKITNNETRTTADLGGGGIYVENRGSLTMQNIIIRNNTADGLGGGLAACVHGKTIIYVNEGAVIYGNTANGSDVKTTNVNVDGSEAVDEEYNRLWTEEHKRAAQDIFTASNANIQDWSSDNYGNSGFIATNQTLVGENAIWTGYTYSWNNGELQLVEVTRDNNGVVFGDRMVFLTASADEDVLNEAVKRFEAAKGEIGYVLIEGNTSAMHGGGIGNNGLLIIGTTDLIGTSSGPEFEATKNLTGKDLTADEFEFVLKKVLKKGEEVVATGKNDADGNVKFNFPEGYFNGKGAGTYEFTMTETKGTETDITYDETKYVVKVTITAEESKVTVGHDTIITMNYVATTTIVKIVDGEEVAVDAMSDITFNNKYEPKDPGDPETPDPKDPEDPEDPETPPENPPENPPEEEIDEPDIPLSDMPEEEIEIDDPDIPLADVPATGDESGVWYVTFALSAAGLVFLTLCEQKKRREEIED